MSKHWISRFDDLGVLSPAVAMSLLDSARKVPPPGSRNGGGNGRSHMDDLRDASRVCLATARSYMIHRMAYIVDIIRWPLYPTFYFLTLVLAYQIAGRTSVDGFDARGYLLVGTIGVVLWQANLWAGGYAIEWERSQGTINALFLTPASRAAVILGYALGSLTVWIVPNALLLAGVAYLIHANANVSDPLAVTASFVSLIIATFALGFAVAGIFVLSRRANLLANFFQSPIYLLSGMLVPISALPASMRLLAAVFPLSAGMDALRGSLLGGAGFVDVSGDLARLLVLSAALFLFGLVMLRRVENVAKRGGELDFD
ncbi:MAG: ABC transporter permease [Nitrolancea sp.]